MKCMLAVCLVFATAMMGCKGSSDPMVGTWRLVLDEKIASKMPDMDMRVEFKEDKTFAVNSSMGTEKQVITGVYELNGKELVLTQKTADGKPSSDKPETVTLADDMRSFPMPGGSTSMGRLVKQ